MKAIDVHCHIDQYDENELKKIFENKQIDFVVGAAINLESGEKLLKMKKIYPGLLVCLGIHPEYPEYFSELEAVKKQITENRNKIIAIGEIGLPWYSLKKIDKDRKKRYIEEGKHILGEFLDLAKQSDLPVILHAIEDTAVAALEELKKRQVKSALFHWFEGSVDIMEEIIAHGYYISVSPDVIYNQRYSRFVAKIPINRIVLESDGPWEYNGQKGVPSMILNIAEFLGKQRKTPEKEIKKIIYENTRRLFGDL